MTNSTNALLGWLKRAARPTKFHIVSFIGLGFVACVLLAGLSAEYFLFTDMTLPPVHIDADAGERLRKYFDQVAAGVSESVPGPIQADETELNSAIVSYLRPLSEQAAERTGVALKDVRVKLHGDCVDVYATLFLHGKTLTVYLEGLLTSDSGSVHFEPLAASVGKLHIPHNLLKDAMQRAMDSPQGRERFKLPPYLQGIRVQESKLVVLSR